MSILLAAALLLSAPPAPEAFSAWFDDKGIAVSKAKDETRKWPWMQGVVELDAEPARVVEVITDFRAYEKTFDPMIQSLKVLGAEGDTTRVHIVWPFPWPLSDRDAIVAYTVETRPDGSTRLSWKSDARKGDPKTGDRIAHVEGETIVEAAGPGKSKVTYRYYGDLGGDFGQARNEKAWKAQPIHYLTALKKRVAPGKTAGPR